MQEIQLLELLMRHPVLDILNRNRMIRTASLQSRTYQEGLEARPTTRNRNKDSVSKITIQKPTTIYDPTRQLYTLLSRCDADTPPRAVYVIYYSLAGLS